MNPFQSNAVADVLSERFAQDRKWGEQNHDPITWLSILMEEVGEMSRAALEMRFPRYLTSGSALNRLREEAVQVAAVALAIVENLDREKWSWPKRLPDRVGATRPPPPLHPKAEQRAEWEALEKKSELEAALRATKEIVVKSIPPLVLQGLEGPVKLQMAVKEELAKSFMDYANFMKIKAAGKMMNVEPAPVIDDGPKPNLEFSVLRGPGDAAEGIFCGEKFYADQDDPHDIVGWIFKKYFNEDALRDGEQVDFRVFANKHKIGEIPF